MERSSTIGYVLIIALFAGFWYLNKDAAQEIQNAENNTEQVIDSVGTTSSSNTVIETTSSSTEDAAIRIATLEEQTTTLSNDLLTIDFTSIGGVPNKVNLNEFNRYDSSDLLLFENNQMTLGYSIPLANGTVINTIDKGFAVTNQTDSSIEFTTELAGDAKMKQAYTLSQGSYAVDYKVTFENMNSAVSPNNRYAELKWNAAIQAQEKTLKDERAVTTVYYKYDSDDDVDYLSETSDDDEKLEGGVKWISFKQKFFNQTLINKDKFEESGIIITSLEIEDSDYVKDLTAQIFIPLEENTVVEDMALYYGPNHYPTLKAQGVELQKIVPLGWGIFGWVNKFIVIPIFNWLDNYFSNYGLIILLLTLIIKSALFFPMYKTYKSTAKMRLLKPELDQIKERTGDDMQKAQQEQMKLYKQAGVSPLGGCLPQLVQMPILFAMFRFFPSSIELRQETLWWAEDLSSYDSIYDLGFEIPFYGDHVSLFTLMMTAVTVLYTYINSQNSGQMVGPMKTVMYLMPIMFLGFFNNYAAALSFYYFLSTCITVIQNYVIRKFVIDEDKLHKQIQESKKKKVKVKKSGLQKRLEDMAKKRGIDPNSGKAKPATSKGKKKK
ncbi:MAG: membrane protein insertase YidC [Bacteroidia bacterium]|jgi:YidC/Oxa1 family membrane protein insertase|tara:strand:- start:19857 stop:21680 length:1824 start_codon:yes stop_codon:yes gene_type:complete